MSVEEHLRRALRADAERVDPDEAAGLAVIRAHGRSARRRRRAVVLGSAGVLLVATLTLVAVRLDGDERSFVVTDRPAAPTVATASPGTAVATTARPAAPAPTAPGTSSPSSPAVAPAPSAAPPTTGPPTTVPTTTAAPTTVVPADTPVLDQVIWPGPDQPSFDDAVAATRSFVEELVGVDAPPLGAFRADGPDTGAVDVYGTTEAGAARDDVVSTVALERIGGHWFVTGATADDVQIEAPAPLDEVAAPVRVAGRGRGYEGTIIVELRDAFRPVGDVLGRRVTIAGCCDDLVPFDAVVPVSGAHGATGVLVAYNDSGLVAVDSFTVLPVRFAPSEPGGDAPGEVTTLHVFFTEYTDGTAGDLVEVLRTVPETAGVLRASLVALLDGPTADEQAAGLLSWLPPDSGAAVLGVDVRDGAATVQLSPRLAELPAVPPADQLIAELNATVFQFENVVTVRYELGDSCAAFDAWLARGCDFTP